MGLSEKTPNVKVDYMIPMSAIEERIKRQRDAATLKYDLNKGN
jgi:hypothetical protein